MFGATSGSWRAAAWAGLLAVVAGCGGGSEAAVELSEVDEELQVPEGLLVSERPPGEDAWTRWHGDGGGGRSAANTLPWYPELLAEVAFPERMDAVTLRAAAGRILAADRNVVRVVDAERGEEVARLCIAEVDCGDGRDDDYLSHRWNSCPGGEQLQVDESGRWAVFVDSVSTDGPTGPWFAKVFDLEALPEPAGDEVPTVDAASVIELPATDIAPWFEGYLLSKGHLLVWFRRWRDEAAGEQEKVVQVRRLPDGEVLWERAFLHRDDSDAPDAVGAWSLAHARFSWPYLVFVDGSGRRVVAFDTSRPVGEDELWRRPEAPVDGRFDPAGVFLVGDAVLTYWGDPSSDPAPFVRYALPGGEASRSCPDTPGGGEVGVAWAALSGDGAWVLGNGGPGLRRGGVAECVADLFPWTDLPAELRPPRPDPATPPALYESAGALNAGLYGVGGDEDPETPERQDYALLWPFDAEAPTALLGPWTRSGEEGCPVGAQQRLFIVAGHRVAALTDERRSRLLLYGDATPPEVGRLRLEEGELRFEARDGGGPLWGAWLAVRPVAGGEVRLLPAEPRGEGLWGLDPSALGTGEHLARPLAMDLSGNVAMGATATVSVP